MMTGILLHHGFYYGLMSIFQNTSLSRHDSASCYRLYSVARTNMPVPH